MWIHLLWLETSMMVKTQLMLGYMAPLVRDSRSAVSRLLDFGSPNNLICCDGHLYWPKDYIIKMAASQYFLMLSINIKVTALVTTSGSALKTAARLMPDKLCSFPGFFIAVNWLGVFLNTGVSSPFFKLAGIAVSLNKAVMIVFETEIFCVLCNTQSA